MPSRYNVGNIEIGIISSNDRAIKNLEIVISKLKSFKQIDKNTQNTFNSMNKLANALDKINQKQKNYKNNSSFNLPKLFNLGKLYLLYNYTKRIAQQFSKFITYSSDYVEILNKFKVSFQDLYQENLKNVNQLAGAFGFSTNTLLDYTATFNNMLKGLKGLSDETSATISQSLTRMAIDYASIFNVSLDRSMNAFQSAISGNIRTLRSISGFDVSETTIFSIYQQLGGTKTMRQLNQLEKRLLRIIAIQRQMQETGAMGDYGRTINCGFDKKLSNEMFVNVCENGVISNYAYC